MCEWILIGTNLSEQIYCKSCANKGMVVPTQPTHGCCTISGSQKNRQGQTAGDTGVKSAVAGLLLDADAR